MTEETDNAVIVSQEGGIATLTLNRPDVRNALTTDVTAGVRDALDSLDDDTRCVILEGAGGAFCAGGDVNAMLQLRADEWTTDEAVRHVINDTADVVKRVYDCEYPTVAKIDGPAVGAGGALALACDVRVFSAEGQIGFNFEQLGLAIDSGVSYLLPREVGAGVAKELVYTGEILDAERAADVGLANRVFEEDFEAEFDAFVETIASGPTAALRTSKRLLRRGFEVSLDTAIEHEAAAQGAMFETDDHEEGIDAFLEHRDPEFGGR
ncbi:enoyl-CoA hydratase [Halogeometricum borinquense DSM 11551]|uniref:Enoyl-CoA hydratase n=2 Tax=Halogeometricum borinquense TaxID=60847 RepID=E4NMD4_HALBP|nr:enoyl-CoA hydratase-related protein [Halogeometricum borinquense]ADQ67339.1 Enoyl-CoA hydratase [Halogeometricum borinquense DSM 11551]ELY28554.1 enoyl-CoA hydratase [Halogeometricum borinquense DSM 11551]RYJ13651.1 enoyl-CoA hydratase [Halogeometricum borinquense]